MNQPADLGELYQYCNAFIDLHPQHRDAVIELYGIAATEIEEGESVENEIRKCLDALKELEQ